MMTSHTFSCCSCSSSYIIQFIYMRRVFDGRGGSGVGLKEGYIFHKSCGNERETWTNTQNRNWRRSRSLYIKRNSNLDWKMAFGPPLSHFSYLYGLKPLLVKWMCSVNHWEPGNKIWRRWKKDCEMDTISKAASIYFYTNISIFLPCLLPRIFFSISWSCLHPIAYFVLFCRYPSRKVGEKGQDALLGATLMKGRERGKFRKAISHRQMEI